MPKGKYEDVPRIPPSEYAEMGNGLFKKSNLFSGKSLADGMSLIPSTLWMRFFKAGLSAEDALQAAEVFDSWVTTIMGWSAKLRRLAFELQSGKLEPRSGPYVGPRTARKRKPRPQIAPLSIVDSELLAAPYEGAPECDDSPADTDIPDAPELPAGPLASELPHSNGSQGVRRFAFGGLFR